MARPSSMVLESKDDYESEVDGGIRPGKSSEDITEIKALKKEVTELRRANEILKSASAFFAAELDRPHRF